MTNILLKAALACAERGWYVLPCKADKTPYTKHGVKDATTDLAKIKTMWKAHPDANVAIDVGRSGMMVYDLDPGSSIKELNEALNGELPKTALESQTPRGGKHLFYTLKGDDVVPSSASKISPHIDVRSDNGYVLLPPSYTEDGAYTWVSEGEASDRTDEMVRTAYTGREKSVDHDLWIIEQDIPENVKLAIAWLQDRSRCKLAIQGEGGDDCTYATAAMMKSYGCSEATALELMYDYWNINCKPPWDFDELSIKVYNGYHHNTSQPGNMTPAFKKAKAEALFDIVYDPDKGEWKEGHFRWVDREGMKRIKPPNWLIKDFIPENSYVMMYGPFGTFKTFIALDIAMSIITGGFSQRNIWGSITPGNVLFAAGEGREEFAKRVAVWEKHKWHGKQTNGIFLTDPVPKITEELDNFVKGSLTASPDGYSLAIIDTVGRSMQGTNENSQENAGAFTALVEALQKKLGCAVLALHHTGKDKGAQGARGSSVFGSDCDVMVALTRASTSDYSVAMEMQKQKDAAIWKEDRWLKLEEVYLSDTQKSLVPMLTTAPPKKTEDKASVKGALVITEMMDQVIYDLLEDDQPRAWKQTALIECIIMDDRMPENMGDTTVKDHLKVIRRARSHYKSRKFYDSKANQGSGQWAWANTTNFESK